MPAEKTRDAIWTAGVAVATLALYVVTLRPDVGGPEDSPKFQFVGHVLGTAHAPGYPLYTLLTYGFGKLPVGNLAYRINLFSAVMAALACAGAFILSRRLGASRGAALAATLSLATGAAFWHNAIVAEVYALAALLVVLVAASLVTWGRSLDRRHLYAACGWFAAGLGNHLTIVGMLPAALIYGISRDRRVLSPRVIAVALVIGVLGMAQYGYIVARTFQHAPHLEARATNGSEVVDVLLSRHQANTRFQYSVSTIVTQRLGLLLSALRDEMGTTGLVLLALGLASGFSRRRADVALVLGASIGMLAIIINLYGDIPGFITPVVVVLWPLAALGIEGMVGLASRFGRRASLLVAAAALVLPAGNLIANQRELDAYRRVDDVQAYRALFPRLPPNAAVVVEDFWTENVLNYLHFSGEYSPDPNPRLIQRDLETVRLLSAAGRLVYAFRPSIEWMRAVGLIFEPAPVDGPSIESWLRELPRGTLIAIAASGRPLPVEWLPPEARQAIGRPRLFGTLVWTVGEPGVQLDQNETASVAEIVHPPSGLTLELRANENGASIASGLEPLVVADAGLTLVTISPEGAIARRLRVPPDASLTLPLDPAIFTFDRELSCATLPAGTSVDVSTIAANGGWLTTMNQAGRSIVDLEFAEAQTRPVQHRLFQGRGTASVDSSSGKRARIVLERTGVSRPVFELVIPDAAIRVMATLEKGGLEELRVCPTSPPPILRARTGSGTIDVSANANQNFGAGWHDAERAGTQPFRWSERVSTFLFPLEVSGPLELRLWLRPASAEGATIDASLANRPAGSCALPAGRWTECQFRAPAESTQAGLNRLVLTASTTVRPDPSRRTADPRELAFVMQAGTIRMVR